MITIKKLFYNGNFYTMEKEGASVEAAIIYKGNFLFVGSYQDCLHILKGESYHKIDLQGKTVLPGFVDSHLHLIGHGEKLETINLSSVVSKKEFLHRLQAASLKHSTIVAEGFHEDLLSDAVITKANLDNWFPNQPVVLIRRCYHTILMNTIALQKWKVADWDVPECEIGKDEHGNLNGYVYEGAMQNLRKLLQAYPLSQLQRYIEAGIKDANSYGITSLVSEDLSYYGDWKKTITAFKNVLNKKSTPSIKLHLLVHHTVWEKIDEAGYFERESHPYLSFDSVKFFLDGSLGSRTAYLKKPYSDDHGNYGICSFTKKQLENKVQKVRNKKRTVAFHVIGDAAFELAISVLKKFPPAIKGQTDRLIHLSLLPDDGIEKLKDMPVVLDLQPIFYSSDSSWIKERIGSERLKNSYLLATFLINNFICGGSSDAPIETINPWEGIFAAIKRKTNNQNPTYTKKEELSLYEAISLYTKGSAQTIKSKCGVIRAGYAADFQVYENDPFLVPFKDLCQLKPLELFINGENILLS